MHTLFLKIFGWFWAAMAFITLSVFLVTWLTLRPPEDRRMGNPFQVFADEAAWIYEREGRASLESYLEYLDRNFLRPSYFLDQNGTELAGRALSPDLRQAAIERARGMGEGRPGPPAQGRFMIMSVRGPSGHDYTFLTEQPERPAGWLSSSPRRLAVQILAILLSAGLGCYLLARHLTAPFVRLREATRQLATGDLSARVGQSLGDRRDEAAELGREFDRMAERIESLLRQQQRLLGDISHELRSPLTRLNLALGVARRQAGELAARAHDRIEREAERLNELIGQLLTLTELESREQTVRRDPIPLADLIRSIAGDADFEARSLHRAVRVVEAAPCLAHGDEWLLRSAIENVVRNAVRHTAEHTAVEIQLAREADALVIRVRDHGPGVPERALPELFRPFYRVDDARDRQAGGTGLGLSITERAIRLHDGAVEARNAPDGGLIVELRLPGALGNSKSPVSE